MEHFRFFNSRSLTLFILPLAMSIAGCVPLAAVNLIDPVTEDTVVGDSQGYVIARVVNAGAVPLPFNYLTIDPINLNADSDIKPDRLVAVGTINGNTTIFASPVNAGKYSLSNVRSYYSWGDRWYSRSVKSGVEDGTFQVLAGDATDLGTVIYYPKVIEDRYIDKLLRSPGSSSGKVIKANMPFLTYNNTIGWDKDEKIEERETAYASAVQNPVVFNKIFRSSNKSLYFIGKLGSILIRHPKGDWDMDAVDVDSDLFAISESSDKNLAVGGEHGALFFKSIGDEWRNISIDPKYTIAEIIFVDSDTLDVISTDKSEVRIFRVTVGLEGTEVNSMAFYSPYDGWHKPNEKVRMPIDNHETSSAFKLIDNIRIRRDAGVDYFFVDLQHGREYSPFNNVSTERFTYDPENWSFYLSKGFSKGIDSMLNAGALNLGIKKAGFWSLTGKNSYYIHDKKEDRWKKIKTKVDWCPKLDKKITYCKWDGRVIHRFSAFEFLSVPVFSNNTDAIAFVEYLGPGISQKKGESKKVIIKTTDKGRTWKLTKAKPPGKYCTDTIPEVKDILLVACQGVSSDIFQSDDEGKTWQHVREHQNF